MTRARLLAFNALAMIVANIISKFVLFIGAVFLLQYLDANLESTYYLVTAFAALIAVNFQDGMVSVTIQRIATDLVNGPRHLGTLYLASFLLAIVLGVIALAAAFLYARFLLEDKGLQGEFILSACALTGTYLVGYASASAGAGFKAYEKLSLEAALLVLQSILNTAIYIYGAHHVWPLSHFFITVFLVNIIYVVLTNIVLVVFVIRPKMHFDVSDAWKIFRESLNLGYATLLRTLQDRMHPFFIDRLAGHQLITQFSSPNQLLVQLKFIPLSVRPALFPTLARKADSASTDFQVYSTALMKFLYMVALPLMILLIIARNDILPFVTSRDPTFSTIYATALQVYPFIGWAVALSFPSQVLRSLFVALKRPEFEFRTVLAGVIVLAILDWILIPRIGVIGAAYGALTCELIILSFGLWLLARIGRPLNFLKLFVLPTLCGIITHSLAEYLYGHHWLLGIASVVLIFPALVLIFRIVSPDEWAIVGEVIKPGSSASREK